MVPKRSPNKPKMVQMRLGRRFGSINVSKMDIISIFYRFQSPRWSENGCHDGVKSWKIRIKFDSKVDLNFAFIFLAILGAIVKDFWCRNEAKLGWTRNINCNMCDMLKCIKTNWFFNILLGRAFCFYYILAWKIDGKTMSSTDLHFGFIFYQFWDDFGSPNRLQIASKTAWQGR